MLERIRENLNKSTKFVQLAEKSSEQDDQNHFFAILPTFEWLSKCELPGVPPVQSNRPARFQQQDQLQCVAQLLQLKASSQSGFRAQKL